MQFEIEKKGKMPDDMRYKLIFKRKREEAQAKAAAAQSAQGNANGNPMVTTRKRSARAEQAIKDMAAKKAAKEAKKLRHMVIVQPQNFSNGKIDKKGVIYDIAGGIVGRVNIKNGKMTTNSGMPIGRYKPKSFSTKLQIQEAINKYSPYFIKQRQMQALAQQQAAAAMYGIQDPNVINVHGMGAHEAMLGGGVYGAVQQANLHGVMPNDAGIFGADEHGLRVGGQGMNATMTAWGAMSNSVHGNFSNNVWGTTGDNVWGTASSDVWGGVSGPDLWGQKGVRFYGTGSGTNYFSVFAGYLGGVVKRLLGLFGYQSRQSREAMRNAKLINAAIANSAARAASSSTPRPTSAPRRR